jgi:Flp pilus assembly protein TadD
LQGEHERAVTACEIAVELNPSSSVAHASLAAALLWSGRAAEALPLFETSIRLSPKDPFLWAKHVGIAFCHYLLGDPAAAEEHARRAQHGPMVAAHGHVLLAAVLAAQGRAAAARAATAQARELRPELSVAVLRRAFSGMARDQLDRLLHDVERAGLPLQ